MLLEVAHLEQRRTWRRLAAILGAHARRPPSTRVGMPAGDQVVGPVLGCSGGAVARQCVGRRSAQRGAKRAARRQVAAGDGTMPLISVSRGAPRRRLRAASSRCGMRAQQAARVGMRRAVEQLVDRRLLDLAAGIHHHHAVGVLGHHAQVVGDQHDRGAEVSCSSRIRSRICAWMVTSSAVVGSSAISTFGLQASAMAIITRWRMPPESWCG